jgi:hypothetical protein
MERNIICIASPQSINKSALISLPMFRKLAGNFKRFGRITAGTKISDRETASLKLALMPWTPHKSFLLKSGMRLELATKIIYKMTFPIPFLKTMLVL